MANVKIMLTFLFVKQIITCPRQYNSVKVKQMLENANLGEKEKMFHGSLQNHHIVTINYVAYVVMAQILTLFGAMTLVFLVRKCFLYIKKVRSDLKTFKAQEEEA